jgi:iron complex outermembrane receptor protein
LRSSFRLLLSHVPLLLALVSLPGVAGAQDRSATLRVLVTDDDGPLNGARVGTDGALALTDPSGRAALDLAPGTHTVTALLLGFAPASLRLTLQAGADTTVVLQLERTVAELDELVVVSTRSNRRVEDLPLRVEVLNRDEIEEKMLMTPGDISALLTESGGMRVQNTNPSLGGANVRIQGLRGRYAILLSDGLPLYGTQASGLGLLQVPPVDLAQVEVIKGAASALYGSSALGGVINLISRTPVGTREALVNGTSLGGVDAVLWMTGEPSERLGYSLLGTANRQGRVDIDSDGWTDVPGYQRVVVRPRVFMTGNGGQSLFVTGGVTAESREGGTVRGAVAPDGEPFDEALQTTRADLGSKLRTRLGGAWELTARASAMAQWRQHTFGTDVENHRLTTGFVEVAANRLAGDLVLVLGTAVQVDWYRHRELPAFDYTFATPGLFTHVEWSASPRLVIAASARLDDQSVYGTFLTPRLSALWRVRGGWTVRASAGTGYYAPTPFIEETEVTGLSRLEPLSDIRAERAASASLDVGRTMGSVEVNATLFGSRISGAVQLRPAAAAGRFEFFNSDGATNTWGGELMARYRTGPWLAMASYMYTYATEPDPADNTLRREVSLTPRHSIGVVGTWEQETGTRLGVEFFYTGVQALDDNPYRTRSVPYLLMGATAQQRLGPWRLYANVENIANVRQTDTDPLVLPSRAPDGRWTTDAWAPLDGRVVNAGVRLDF